MGVPHLCEINLPYVVQDARELLAEVRELTFALEESNAATQQLQTELTAAQVGCLSLLSFICSNKIHRIKESAHCPLQFLIDGR